MLRKLLDTFARCDNFMSRLLGEECWDFIMIILFVIAWLFNLYLAFLLLRFLLWSNDYLALAIIAVGLVWLARRAIKRNN